MTDALVELVEKISSGLIERLRTEDDPQVPWEKMHPINQDTTRTVVRAALAAIDSSGTHVVVPVEDLHK